jgi:hypothetical protein
MSYTPDFRCELCDEEGAFRAKAELKSDYLYPGTANYPVGGILFSRGSAYIPSRGE